MSAGFALLQRFLRETSGWALDPEKRYLVEDRLQPVLDQARISGLDQLATALRNVHDRDLAQRVTEALTINETSFFREKALFADFAERMLPEIVRTKTDRCLRIWSIGCSTGQEPYSLAMALDGQAGRLAGWRVEIVATDLSHAVIERAKRGAYSQFEVQRGVPIASLLRYFHRNGDDWVVNDDLKARISFEQRNLLAGAPGLCLFDVVFCRNVLIYFDAAVKQRMLEKVAGALNADGYLVLGATERTGDASGAWRPDDKLAYVFRKEKAQHRGIALQFFA